jgi:hypothetical protein
MLDPVEMQKRYEAVMMRHLKEHDIFEGVVAMFNAKQAEIERLREALLQIAGKVSQSDKSFDGDMASDIARAALGEGKE